MEAACHRLGRLATVGHAWMGWVLCVARVLQVQAGVLESRSGATIAWPIPYPAALEVPTNPPNQFRVLPFGFRFPPCFTLDQVWGMLGLHCNSAFSNGMTSVPVPPLPGPGHCAAALHRAGPAAAVRLGPDRQPPGAAAAGHRPAGRQRAGGATGEAGGGAGGGAGDSHGGWVETMACTYRALLATSLFPTPLLTRLPLTSPSAGCPFRFRFLPLCGYPLLNHLRTA